VRRTAKRLGLSTDSSFRFERGADPQMAPIAAMRAASLIVEIAGGKASQLSDIRLSDFPPFHIDLSLRKFTRITGKDLGKDTILDILKALEIRAAEDKDGDTLHLEVPPYRVDVQRDVDVMEDLLRVYGYNNIETPAALHASVDFEPYFDRNALKEKFADHLSANGFYEIMNNSLVPATLGDERAVHLVNPLSEDLGILRPTLLHGMLESIAYNQNRQNEDLAFYEFGKTYAQGKDGYEEQPWLVMALTGQQQPTHWASEPQLVTLQSMAREAARIEHWFAFTGERVETEHPEFEYGLDLVHKGAVVLRYGKVNNDLAARYGLRNEVFYLLADWPALVARHQAYHPRFQEIPLYPAIRRDLSLLIDQEVSFDQMRQVIAQANPKLIRSVALHDVYEGKGVPEGKKSYLVSIELRDDSKTLADKAAEKVMQRVVQLLSQETGAEVRK
jgi:phenylalanyl-tRNA synthetase beta chain